MAGGISGQSVTIAYDILTSRAGPKFMKGIHDQIFNDHPTWAEMTRGAQPGMFDGGERVYATVDLARGQSDGSYRDLDTIDTARVDTETIIQLQTSEYAKPITVSDRERDLHRGKLAVVRALDASSRKAMKRLVYDLNSHLHLDGTGNSSKRLTGFAAVVAADPTGSTLYGLSQANNTAWRNQYQNNANGVTNLLLHLRSSVDNATIGNDGPTVILGNSAGCNAVEGQMTADINHNLPVGAEGTRRSGDPAVPRRFYAGIPIVSDKDWTQYGTATGPGQLVGLNLRHWTHFNASARVNKGEHFELQPPRVAPAQTATVAILRYHGAFLCTSLRHQFVIFNIGADA